MKRLAVLVLSIALATGVFGCGSDGGGGADAVATPSAQQTAEEQIMELEASGAIPALERGPTITGTDTNADGVRDDIEAYIDSNYSTAPQRAAAIQTAKAMQEVLVVDTTDIVAVKKANRNLSRANHCIYSQFDGNNGSKQPAQVSQELESMATNTKERLLAYLAFNKALDGTSWALPEGDSCE